MEKQFAYVDMKRILTNALFAIFMAVGLVMAANAQTLPTGKWTLDGYNFKQKIAFPIDKKTITLNIDADGGLGGNSGCNVFGGNYKFDEGKLKIGPLVSTMRACDEPFMSFERSMHGVLNAADSYTYEDGVLTFTDTATHSFVRFKRIVEDDREACE